MKPSTVSQSIALEVCVAADDLNNLPEQMLAVNQGGAQRVELCAAMADEGLSPELAAIELARSYLDKSLELLVMVRPRAGDFCYSPSEIHRMQQQIERAATAGANGVVLGSLNDQQQLALPALQCLTATARQAGLKITFHRAFDALSHPLDAIMQLSELGVDRVLSSGTSWHSKQGATDGLPRLSAFLQQAQGKMELVVGGGVNLHNLPYLHQSLQTIEGPRSFHCYSAALSAGRVDPLKLRQLVSILGC